MIDLAVTKSIVVKSFFRSGLVLQKYSPEILMGVGILGVVGTAVAASYATLELDRVNDEAEQVIEKIEAGREKWDEEKYTPEMYRKDLAVAKIQHGMAIGKLYLPAAAIAAVSITCLLGSHKILTVRNAGLVAAYKLITEAFGAYRERVTIDAGEDKDREYYYGEKKEIVTNLVTGEDGKKTKVKTEIITVDPTVKKIYGRNFDESNQYFKNDTDLNLTFLKRQQEYANHMLHSRGHLFLSEVYDMLGLKRSKECIVVGWLDDDVKGDKDANGNVLVKRDHTVDFGLDKVYAALPSNYYTAGYFPEFRLDFNVDGTIWDKIA